MEKGKDLLHISITKRVVPRCVYSETQKFHLLRMELSDHSFSGHHILLGLLIFNFNVEKIRTYVNYLDRQVEEVLENPSFVASLLSRPCLYFKTCFPLVINWGALMLWLARWNSDLKVDGSRSSPRHRAVSLDK